MTDSTLERRSEGTVEITVPGPEGRREPSPRRVRWAKFSFRATPYLYTSPFFIVFAVVGLFPMFFTLFISFFNWKLTTTSYHNAKFIGLDNYTNVLLHDGIFWKALGNTVSIFLISTIPQIVVATFIAVLLDRNLRAKVFWRMGVLLPYIVAPVAIAIIFSAIFTDPDQGGLLNSVLRLIHLPAVTWHSGRIPSHVAVAMMVNFQWTGYNSLILLAAMQAVPRDLYEAAAIDGAGSWRRFWSVTLPSIRGTMTFVVLTATMGGLRIFDQVRLFDPQPGANGGAGGVFRTVVLYLYSTGFSAQSQLGKASAIAWILFFFILLVTGLNFFLTRRISDENSAAAGDRRRGRRKEVSR